MKKIIQYILIATLFLLGTADMAYAVAKVRPYTCLTGGTTGCLDKTDGDILNDNDAAFVINSTGTYFYYLEATSGAAESSPNIIAPDTNAGTKRWLLLDFFVDGTITAGDASAGVGAIALKNATNANTYTIQSGVATGDFTITLPVDDGTAGQYMQTNGSGVLTWAAGAGGGDILADGSVPFTGVLSQDNTTDTSSGTTGSVHTDGGLGVAKSIYVGTGIIFPSTAVGSANVNVLDDYEEGTYNPTLVCGTSGSFGLAAHADTLAYTKIGQLVSIQGRILTAEPDTCVGQLRLSIPFDTAPGTEFSYLVSPSIVIRDHGDAELENPYLQGETNVAYMAVTNITDNGTVENVDDTRVDGAFYIQVSFSYITDVFG